MRAREIATIMTVRTVILFVVLPLALIAGCAVWLGGETTFGIALTVLGVTLGVIRRMRQ
jgi:hypothetical protein